MGGRLCNAAETNIPTYTKFGNDDVIYHSITTTKYLMIDRYFINLISL